MIAQSRPNRMPRKILLATDLSARCDRALDRAASLAVNWQAEIVAVHALEQSDDFYSHDLERRLPSWRQQSSAGFIVEEQLRRDIVEAAPNVTAIVEQSEPTALILRVATARECDLIVTGIARDETLGRFGLGTTVDRLARRSRVPLLIVKQRVRGPYRNILVATDFSECARGALQTAMAFFPDQELTLFHAYDTPFASRAGDPSRLNNEYRLIADDDCRRFLTEAGVTDNRQRNFRVLAEDGHPSHLIHQYVRDKSVDLVILGTHGRSPLLNIVIGSTAREIMASLSCDALLIREPGSAIEIN